MDLENILGTCVVMGVVLFVGWCWWITSSPERLEKIRKTIGIPK